MSKQLFSTLLLLSVLSCTTTHNEKEIGPQLSSSKQEDALENLKIVDQFLIVSNRASEIFSINMSGEKEFLFNGKYIEVYDSHIFVEEDRVIKEYTIDKTLISETPVPHEVKYYIKFSIIPDKGFAFYDNTDDIVYFIDFEGNFLKQGNIPGLYSADSQHIDTLIKDEKIYVSGDNNGALFTINIDKFKLYSYRSYGHRLPGPSIGSIYYHKNSLYITNFTEIFKFTDDDKIEKVFGPFDKNITGFVIVDDFIYASINFEDKIIKFDMNDGTSEIFNGEIIYPTDLELLTIYEND